MDRIEETILRLHTDLMKSMGIVQVSSMDMEIRPQNGITSESIVTLLLDIEDELDVELEAYLADIRKCKTIGLLVDIIKRACEDK